MEKIQDEIEKEISRMTDEVQKKARLYLDSYRKNREMIGASIDVGITFDEVAAFMAGLLSITSLGGLTSIGAMLGGGWLAANTTGTFAVVGSFIGEAGLAVSQVLGQVLSFITGPIGMAIIAAGAIICFLFRKPWQKKLAEEVCSSCKENSLLEKLQNAVSEYWEATKNAFEKGSNNVEKEWEDQLIKMKHDIEHPDANRRSIELHIKFLKKMKIYWEGLPWDQAELILLENNRDS